MQILYSMSRDKKLGYEEALQQYRINVRQSFELYLHTLLQLMRIAEYAQQDATNRSAKLLPTEEDLNFSNKFGNNELIRSVTQNEGFNRMVRLFKLEEKIDEDKTRQIYTEFAKTDEYKAFILNSNTTDEDQRQILLSLYKHCMSNEMFSDLIEDNFPLWIDDESLIVGAIKKTIKALPAPADFYEEFRPPLETTVEFGEVLFKIVNESDEELLRIIEPTLKNWDAERVAVLDMILLKMALCELMYFPTIPTKVTLNEFVEISKMYSTDKSKDFINGILDRLMKQLNKEGKIKKEGRGLQE
ncbi:MAG: transcription antitermination factor NusB [Saprospiraceae bacterium]|nr:transcription antitermination factor NusB [Saprospiraceae bacterium]